MTEKKSTLTDDLDVQDLIKRVKQYETKAPRSTSEAAGRAATAAPSTTSTSFSGAPTSFDRGAKAQRDFGFGTDSTSEASFSRESFAREHFSPDAAPKKSPFADILNQSEFSSPKPDALKRSLNTKLEEPKPEPVGNPTSEPSFGGYENKREVPAEFGATVNESPFGDAGNQGNLGNQGNQGNQGYLGNQGNFDNQGSANNVSATVDLGKSGDLPTDLGKDFGTSSTVSTKQAPAPEPSLVGGLGDNSSFNDTVLKALDKIDVPKKPTAPNTSTASETSTKTTAAMAKTASQLAEEQDINVLVEEIEKHKDRLWIVMVGNAGCGKSYISAALLRALKQFGESTEDKSVTGVFAETKSSATFRQRVTEILTGEGNPLSRTAKNELTLFHQVVVIRDEYDKIDAKLTIVDLPGEAIRDTTMNNERWKYIEALLRANVYQCWCFVADTDEDNRLRWLKEQIKQAEKQVTSLEESKIEQTSKIYNLYPSENDREIRQELLDQLEANIDEDIAKINEVQKQRKKLVKDQVRQVSTSWRVLEDFLARAKAKNNDKINYMLIFHKVDTFFQLYHAKKSQDGSHMTWHQRSPHAALKDGDEFDQTLQEWNEYIQYELKRTHQLPESLPIYSDKDSLNSLVRSICEHHFEHLQDEHIPNNPVPIPVLVNMAAKHIKFEENDEKLNTVGELLKQSDRDRKITIDGVTSSTMLMVNYIRHLLYNLHEELHEDDGFFEKLARRFSRFFGGK